MGVGSSKGVSTAKSTRKATSFLKDDEAGLAWQINVQKNKKVKNQDTIFHLSNGQSFKGDNSQGW